MRRSDLHALEGRASIVKAAVDVVARQVEYVSGGVVESKASLDHYQAVFSGGFCPRPATARREQVKISSVSMSVVGFQFQSSRSGQEAISRRLPPMDYSTNTVPVVLVD